MGVVQQVLYWTNFDDVAIILRDENISVVSISTLPLKISLEFGGMGISFIGHIISSGSSFVHGVNRRVGTRHTLDAIANEVNEKLINNIEWECIIEVEIRNVSSEVVVVVSYGKI